VKHLEEHKKEIRLRKGIILVLGGLNRYLECFVGGHREKRMMGKHPKDHKKEIRLRKGIVLVLGGLDWYLEYC